MLQSIKAFFDIKNSALAGYLGIALDTINSVMTGRRELGSQSWQSLLELHKALELHTDLNELEHAKHFLDQERAEAELLFENDIKKLESRLARKKDQLAALQKTRETWLRGLHACECLLQTELTADKRKWLALRKKHLALKLKERSLYKERVLEIEILGVEGRLVLLAFGGQED